MSCKNLLQNPREQLCRDAIENMNLQILLEIQVLQKVFRERDFHLQEDINMLKVRK